jgi:hypothetical protein
VLNNIIWPLAANGDLEITAVRVRYGLVKKKEEGSNLLPSLRVRV